MFFKQLVPVLLLCIAFTNSSAQNDKLVGRWIPVRIIMDKIPQRLELKITQVLESKKAWFKVSINIDGMKPMSENTN